MFLGQVGSVEMSLETTAVRFARRCLDKAVAYVREFVLIATFAAICVAVTAPTIIATGGAMYWLGAQLGLEGLARTVYFGAGAVVLMFVFAVLHRFVQTLGRVMLGATRSPMWQT